MSESFYNQLYATIGALTPLKSDCGRLCGGACCVVSPELPGMFLFPGEEVLYIGQPGFTLRTAELPGYGAVTLLDCDGDCDRSLRPLACRIFPLAPAVLGDTVGVRLDTRGRMVCPLCRGSRSALHSVFGDAVHQVFEELMRNPETAHFMRALSQQIDAFGQPL